MSSPQMMRMLGLLPAARTGATEPIRAVAAISSDKPQVSGFGFMCCDFGLWFVRCDFAERENRSEQLGIAVPLGSMGLSVELEDAMDFGDGLRIFRRTVIARRDKFAPGTVEMAAPVRNNAVTAIRSVTTATVTDDRVIGNSLRDRNSVNSHHETIIRRHSVDAVGKAL